MLRMGQQLLTLTVVLLLLLLLLLFLLMVVVTTVRRMTHRWNWASGSHAVGQHGRRWGRTGSLVMRVMVLAQVERVLILIMAGGRLIAMMTVMMMMMVKMLMVMRVVMLLRRHPHLLLLLVSGGRNRTARTAHAFFVQFAHQRCEVGADDVLGPCHRIVGGRSGGRSRRRTNRTVGGVEGVARAPGRFNQFAVQSATEPTLIGFGHGRDGGEFASHRIMTERSLDDARRIVGSSPSAVFALQQFDLLVQEILRHLVHIHGASAFHNVVSGSNGQSFLHQSGRARPISGRHLLLLLLLLLR